MRHYRHPWRTRVNAPSHSVHSSRFYPDDEILPTPSFAAVFESANSVDTLVSNVSSRLPSDVESSPMTVRRGQRDPEPQPRSAAKTFRDSWQSWRNTESSFRPSAVNR